MPTSDGFSRLLDTVIAGDPDEVKRVLEEESGVLNNRDDLGWPALSHAVFRFKNAAAAALIEAGADVEATSGRGNTALHWAAHSNNGPGIILLLEAGADKNHQNRFGLTPLHMAAARGCRSAIAVLRDAGSSFTLKNRLGQTAQDVLDIRSGTVKPGGWCPTDANDSVTYTTVTVIAPSSHMTKSDTDTPLDEAQTVESGVQLEVDQQSRTDTQWQDAGGLDPGSYAEMAFEEDPIEDSETDPTQIVIQDEDLYDDPTDDAEQPTSTTGTIQYMATSPDENIVYDDAESPNGDPLPEIPTSSSAYKQVQPTRAKDDLALDFVADVEQSESQSTEDHSTSKSVALPRKSLSSLEAQQLIETARMSAVTQSVQFDDVANDPKTRKYLHGVMSRDEAAELVLLSGTDDGTFLVRRSEEDNDVFFLCVTYRGKATHHQLARDPDGVYLVNKKQYGNCSSLSSLIDCLSQPIPEDGWRVPLTIAIPPRDANGTELSTDLQVAESVPTIAIQEDGTVIVTITRSVGQSFGVSFSGVATRQLVKPGSDFLTLKSIQQHSVASGLEDYVGFRVVRMNGSESEHISCLADVQRVIRPESTRLELVLTTASSAINNIDGTSEYLHGAISREEAERIVGNAGTSDGFFLVREPEKIMPEGTFLLCVQHNGQLTHHVLRRHFNGYYLVDSEQIGECSTLSALIRNLGQPDHPQWPVPLTNPIAPGVHNTKEGDMIDSILVNDVPQPTVVATKTYVESSDVQNTESRKSSKDPQWKLVRHKEVTEEALPGSIDSDRLALFGGGSVRKKGRPPQRITEKVTLTAVPVLGDETESGTGVDNADHMSIDTETALEGVKPPANSETTDSKADASDYNVVKDIMPTQLPIESDEQEVASEEMKTSNSVGTTPGVDALASDSDYNVVQAMDPDVLALDKAIEEGNTNMSENDDTVSAPSAVIDGGASDVLVSEPLGIQSAPNDQPEYDLASEQPVGERIEPSISDSYEIPTLTNDAADDSYELPTLSGQASLKITRAAGDSFGVRFAGPATRADALEKDAQLYISGVAPEGPAADAGAGEYIGCPILRINGVEGESLHSLEDLAKVLGPDTLILDMVISIATASPTSPPTDGYAVARAAPGEGSATGYENVSAPTVDTGAHYASARAATSPGANQDNSESPYANARDVLLNAQRLSQQPAETNKVEEDSYELPTLPNSEVDTAPKTFEGSVSITVQRGQNGFGVVMSGAKTVSAARNQAPGFFISGLTPDTPGATAAAGCIGWQIVTLNGKDVSSGSIAPDVTTAITSDVNSIDLVLYRNDDLCAVYGFDQIEDGPLTNTRASRMQSLAAIAAAMDAAEEERAEGPSDAAMSTDSDFDLRWVGSATLVRSMEFTLDLIQKSPRFEYTTETRPKLRCIGPAVRLYRGEEALLEFMTDDIITTIKHGDAQAAMLIRIGLLNKVYLFSFSPKYEADSFTFHMLSCFSKPDAEQLLAAAISEANQATPEGGAVVASPPRKGAAQSFSIKFLGKGVLDAQATAADVSKLFEKVEIQCKHGSGPKDAVLVIEADAIAMVSSNSGRHLKMIPADNISDCHEIGTDVFVVSEAATEISKHSFIRFETQSDRETVKRAIGTQRSAAASRLTQYALQMGVNSQVKTNSMKRRPSLNTFAGTLIDIKNIGTLRIRSTDDNEIRVQSQELILLKQFDYEVTPMAIRVTASRVLASSSVILINDGTIVKRYQPTNIAWCGTYDLDADTCFTGKGLDGHTLMGLAFVDPFLAITWVDVFACKRADSKQLAQLVATARHSRKDLSNAFKAVGSTDMSAHSQFHEHQIDRKKFTPERMLGSGNFGTVFLASCQEKGTRAHYAMKLLHDTSGQRLWQLRQAAFIKEARTLLAFDHPNIVHLRGVSFDHRPWMMATEFLPYGDLERVLRLCRGRQIQLGNAEQVFFCGQVAAGMAHIASRRFTHLDLAARNVLLGERNHVKIADFGNAQEWRQQKDSWRLNIVMELSQRWMAPEAFKSKVFSEATDVWSFGVFCFEIASSADVPYKTVATDDVQQHLTSGGTLQMPKECPRDIRELVRKCCDRVDTARPTFIEITQRCEEMIKTLSTEPNKIELMDVGKLIQLEETGGAHSQVFKVDLPCLV